MSELSELSIDFDGARAHLEERSTSDLAYHLETVVVHNEEGQRLEIRLAGATVEIEEYISKIENGQLSFFVSDEASDSDFSGNEVEEDWEVDFDSTPPLTALHIEMLPIDIELPYTVDVVIDPVVRRIGGNDIPHVYYCRNVDYVRATIERIDGELLMHVGGIRATVDAFNSTQTIVNDPSARNATITIRVDGREDDNEYTLRYRCVSA